MSSNYPFNQNNRQQIPNSTNIFFGNNNSPLSNQNRPNNYFPNNNGVPNFYSNSTYQKNYQPNFYGQNMNPGIPPYVNPNLPHPNNFYSTMNNPNLNNNFPFINRPNINNSQNFKNNQCNNEKENILQQLKNEKNNLLNMIENNNSIKLNNDSDVIKINGLKNKIENYNNCEKYLIGIQQNTINDSLSFIKTVIADSELEPDSIEYILGLEINEYLKEEEEKNIKKIISDCKYDLLGHFQYKTINNEEKSNLKEFITNKINTLKIKKENEKRLDINGNLNNNKNYNENENFNYNNNNNYENQNNNFNNNNMNNQKILIDFNDFENNNYNNNNNHEQNNISNNLNNFNQSNNLYNYNQNPNKNNFNQSDNLYNNNYNQNLNRSDNLYNNTYNQNPNKNNFNQSNYLYNNNNYNQNPYRNNLNQPNNLYNNNNNNNYNQNSNNFNQINNLNSLNSFEPDKNSLIQIKYIYLHNHQLDKVFDFKYGDEPNEMVMKIYQENPDIENPILCFKNGSEIKIDPNKDKYIGKLFERQPKEIYVHISQ